MNPPDHIHFTNCEYFTLNTFDVMFKTYFNFSIVIVSMYVYQNMHTFSLFILHLLCFVLYLFLFIYLEQKIVNTFVL
jgi:hypothetical protein